ncbi:MAG: indolepyruvate oxidoreductase subunit beta [Bacteroidetes bacterium]|nr:MAG: indolepyruvate oxidoreductase subunit beta [Bacteroidota bacterium]RLD93760.1 MAG: indolepyruvate oxidoreductase subunit beta [Bacteroidota bacterium]
MKKDIILAGVGGQGILSIAAVIGMAAVESGLYLKQAEVHGMSQRGGAVQSHLRISDSPIASDLIPEGSCDMILSVEPMEALRYLPFLAKDGWVVTSTKTFENIEDYPAEDELFEQIRLIENHVLIDANAIARELGSQKISNMVMLGAASMHLGLGTEYLEGAMNTLFGRKGEEVVALNIKALMAGKEGIRI